MKRFFLLIPLFFSFILAPAFAQKVAIFDYDDRLDKPDTVAKHIEKKLKESVGNIAIEQFSGKETESIASDVLKKLDNGGYDLIITVTSDALLLAVHYLKKTPVIYTNANNPKFLGMETLDAPGGNISGASYYVSIERQIGFFKKFVPGVKKIGFLFDEENRSRRIEIPETRDACKKAGIEYAIELVNAKEELGGATEKLIDRKVGAIVVTSSGKLYNNVEKFKPVCDNAKIPIFSFHKNGVKNGAIAALASDYYLMVEKLVVPMVIKVLREKVSPGSMPAAFLDENLIFLNLSQAKKLGIEIPEEIRKMAVETY